MIELKSVYDPPYNQWYGVKNHNLLRFKITYGGSLPNASALPEKALMPGVMFHMENDGSNYMWNGVAWDKLDSNPFVGATSSKDGIQGLVPQPKVANREGFLYGGGGWKNLDASDVKTGVFALARIPAAAMERLVPVDDQEERFALTTATVQNGDTVLQRDTKIMYRVVDQNELDNSNGYVEYQAARASVVPWDGITGTPETFTPSAHTHDWSDITDEPDFALNSEVVHVYNNAGSHNSIYRGKDLTNIYSVDDLYEKMSEDDFSDLYIGDYITKHLTIDYSAELDDETISVSCDEDFNFRIAHFDYWYGMGDTALNQHHIVFIPDKPFFNCKMRKTDTTVGGIPATNVWSLLQNQVYSALNAASCFNGKILTYRDWIPDSVNANALSAVGANFMGSTVYTSTMWRDVKVGLLHEPMVYGGTHFSSSGYDTGCGKSQLALFRLDPTWIHCGSHKRWYWLCAVSSSTIFVFAGGNGTANHGNASNPAGGVRPFFLIG